MLKNVKTKLKKSRRPYPFRRQWWRYFPGGMTLVIPSISQPPDSLKKRLGGSFIMSNIFLNADFLVGSHERAKRAAALGAEKKNLENISADPHDQYETNVELKMINNYEAHNVVIENMQTTKKLVLFDVVQNC